MKTDSIIWDRQRNAEPQDGEMIRGALYNEILVPLSTPPRIIGGPCAILRTWQHFNHLGIPAPVYGETFVIISLN